MHVRPTDNEVALASGHRTTASASVPFAQSRGAILRQPTSEDLEASTIAAFIRWLAEERGNRFTSYEALWEWSVQEPDLFWGALWDYFRIEAATSFSAVHLGSSIQDSRWFPGARLNFAQHLLRHEQRLADRTAIICHSEDGAIVEWSWSQFGDAVRRLAMALRTLGVQPGDRIAGYLPNIAQTAIAFVATTAVGAVWSSCSPEFGMTAAHDRFGQIEPKLFFAVPEYSYAGKIHDRRGILTDLLAALPSIEQVVLLGEDATWLPAAGRYNVSSWDALLDTPAPDASGFHFEQVPADHPLWIVYTSGTSGPPKAIVHNHAGALLGAMKDLCFHLEATEGSRLFFYSTTSWIVWNLATVGLSLGASLVLYDGSPFQPDIGRLWEIVEQSGATAFATSPGFVTRMMDKAYIPAQRHALDQLDVVILAGAVAEESLYEWLAAALPPRTRIISQAGSTEICGGYAGGVRILPSRAGEISARLLGMDVEAVDDEMRPIRNRPGELVIRSPFPHAPQCLWNDPAGERFFETYLAAFDGKWRQGDNIIIYDDGACRVLGRSDATMKRHGVRIGSNEIYRALAAEKTVSDAIAVCPQSGAFNGELLLFVQLAQGYRLDEPLRRQIEARIAHDLSPRHVPDLIIQSPGIPYSTAGKRLEIPLRHLLEESTAPEQFAASLEHDPAIAAWFVASARQRT